MGRPPLRDIPPAPLEDGEHLLGVLVGESTDTDSWAVGHLMKLAGVVADPQLDDFDSLAQEADAVVKTLRNARP